MQVGCGNTSVIITDDSETLGLDKLEFAVVGGTCGSSDRGSVSQNGSNE